MPRPRAKSSGKRNLSNQKRSRVSFSHAISQANRRAHDQANRRSGRRGLKSVRAAIATADMDDDMVSLEWTQRLIRWIIALLLLPSCIVTTWTFLSRFSHATLNQGFWQTHEFWYFATGCLLMVGWLGSGLLRSFFLYLYVLGHELTHVLFVILFRGKVSGFHVSSQGGYITTNKTNLLIALSPYFVPFWSLVFATLFALARILTNPGPNWDLAFYAVIGSTWSFHMLWTLWMIPRDQPDLKENGTFLSLVIIYLANLLLLIALLCAAEDAPLLSAKEFAMDWLRNAIITGDAVIRWLGELMERLDGRVGLRG